MQRALSRAAKQSLCSAGQLEDMRESSDKEEWKGSGVCGGEKRKKIEKKEHHILDKCT